MYAIEIIKALAAIFVLCILYSLSATVFLLLIDGVFYLIDSFKKKQKKN